MRLVFSVSSARVRGRLSYGDLVTSLLLPFSFSFVRLGAAAIRFKGKSHPARSICCRITDAASSMCEASQN